MSDNKMGGVPTHTRDALYRFFDAQNDKDDEEWAAVIDKMTKLGPKESMKRLKKKR